MLRTLPPQPAQTCGLPTPWGTQRLALFAWLAVPLVLALGSALRAEDAPPGSPRPVQFTRDIRPLFKNRCFACHGSLKQTASLRVDTAAALLAGGDSGPSVTPSDPAGSLLLQKVLAEPAAGRMPPEGEPLTAAQIDMLRRWIAAGAPAPEQESPEPDPRAHWAFQPPVKRPLPGPLAGQPTPTNPVDAWIAARLATAEITPRPPADKATLLRRVTLDLTGLPPTRRQLLDFEADTSPGAYERVVDRLLGSPQYGERWGRHWMDVWRYADWHGRRYVPDVWNSAPQIFHWRDWIVRSLNADRGYDQMVREMLAADEVSPGDRSAGVATGYLIRNWYALNPNDWMRNTVEHTGKAFLGLTFNCAHCHDHKYDPITHADYFRLRAFFEPIGIRQDRLPGQADPGPFQEYSYSTLRKIQRLGTVQVFDKTPDAPTWFYTGGDERNKVKERGSIVPGVPDFLSGDQPLNIAPVALPPLAHTPSLEPALQQTLREDAARQLEQARAELTQALAEPLDPTPELATALTQAQAALAAARVEVANQPSGRPLVGAQSLLFQAGTGRAITQNRLPGLKSLQTGFTIEFRVRLLTDTHFNFQLARDVKQGLTAAYIAFDAGRVMSYRPGGFTEFQAGEYHFAKGEANFQVRLVLDLEADQALLSVDCLDTAQPVVSATPIAINGWNPVGDSNKCFSFDARAGSLVAVDELILRAGPVSAQQRELGDQDPAIVAHFTFEGPGYTAGKEIYGLGSFENSPFAIAPGLVQIAAQLGDSSLRALETRVAEAERAVNRPRLRREAATKGVEAATAGQAALEARMAADQARQADGGQDVTGNSGAGAVGADGSGLATAARSAHQAERTALALLTHAQAQQAEWGLATAEARPASDANRGKEMEAARQKWQPALAAHETARKKLDEPQAESYTATGPSYPRQSTGRRKALAEWLTSPRNPLFARVAVNHMFLRHFQAPLVASVFDFGRNGALPTHPELLDWLAVELVEAGYRMKPLHRLLVTSEAYRRSSATGSDRVASERDPENRLLWRMNVGRMEAEVVRDSVLSLSGQLDTTLGGPELENSQALTTFRRSLYYSCQPEEDGKSQFSALFDGPEPADCYRRSRTIIPQQALALTNSTLVVEQSQKLAAQLSAELVAQGQPGSPAFVVAATQQILARTPTVAELEACLAFLGPPGGDPAGQATRRAGLVRVLLNHNDFIAIR
ncbi:MAG: DUF1553 domain-containing protein [Planctomycetaceae bacterium]